MTRLTTTPDIPAIDDPLLWERALADYQATLAHYDMLCDRVEQAQENDGSPDRVHHYFEEYQLGIGMKREAVNFWLAHYNLRAAVKIDQNKTADEFMDYQRRVLEARERSGVQALEAERSAYYPMFDAARAALVAVPAPHRRALLIKLELTARTLDDDHAELVLADARRLLGGEA